MAVVVCQLPIPHFHVLNHLTPNRVGTPRQPNVDLSVSSFPNKDDEKPDQSTILSMVQHQKPTSPIATAPYVHPLVSRSSGLMSMTSLEMCTESLGSESGSGDFSDFDRGLFNSSRKVDDIRVKQRMQQSQKSIEQEKDVDQQNSVNYHFSVSRRNPASRSFPPPLPSISRRDGTCIQMRARRHDGRLVVDAVPAASQNYLHSSRYDGRLLLSFIDSTTNADTYPAQESQLKKQIVDQSARRVNHHTDADDDEEHEEEVEVIDRGTMVEVKVSTQSQHASGEKKVIRSSLVINKFVSGTPLTNQNRWVKPHDESRNSDTTEASRPSSPVQRRLAATTTTAAAAAVAVSSVSGGSPEVLGLYPDNKLIYTSKRRNREELLKQMRRCSELRRPLFFWESASFAPSGGCLSC